MYLSTERLDIPPWTTTVSLSITPSDISQYYQDRRTFAFVPEVVPISVHLRRLADFAEVLEKRGVDTKTAVSNEDLGVPAMCGVCGAISTPLSPAPVAGVELGTDKLVFRAGEAFSSEPMWLCPLCRHGVGPKLAYAINYLINYLIVGLKEDE